MLGGGRNPAVLSRRDGADDESPRRAAEGNGEEDHLVGGGGDCGRDGPDDAPMARALRKGRLRGLGGPAQGETEREADSGGYGREGAWAVSGTLLRPEYSSLPREVAGRARDQAELYVGAESPAGRRAGSQTAQAGSPPAEAAAAAAAGDVTAY